LPLRLRTLHRLFGAIALLLACFGCASSREQICVPQLGRTGFLQELLFPQGTVRTPLFDDYTEGSYHVDKLDLLEGVRALRPREPVQGLVVFGPAGPIWSYYVFLFVSENDQVRLNAIEFSHARITEKSTRRLSPGEYREALARLTARQCVTAGGPSFLSVRGQRISDLSLDWHYILLVADWSDGSERLWHCRGSQRTLSSSELEVLSSGLDDLLAESTTTYSTSLPEGYEAFICPEHP
jgi:hypothetical protein